MKVAKWKLLQSVKINQRIDPTRHAAMTDKSSNNEDDEEADAMR